MEKQKTKLQLFFESPRYEVENLKDDLFFLNSTFQTGYWEGREKPKLDCYDDYEKIEILKSEKIDSWKKGFIFGRIDSEFPPND